jgi:hypothetical protein
MVAVGQKSNAEKIVLPQVHLSDNLRIVHATPFRLHLRRLEAIWEICCLRAYNVPVHNECLFGTSYSYVDIDIFAETHDDLHT